MTKYNKVSILLIALALFFCISVIGTVSASDEGLADTASPKFHIDSNNTGQSDNTGPQTNNTVWDFTTNGGIRFSSPAIGSDGTIYIGSEDGKLYAINPDGTEKWNFNTSASYIFGSPAIGTDGTIYIGGYDLYDYGYNYTYAINPDGTLKWSYDTGLVYGSPSIGADGTIYIGSYNNNNLYALNPDGTLKWTYATGRIQGCPAIGSDGTIYIGSYDRNFYAVNPNGTEKWTSNIGNYIYGTPAIGSDGTIYFGDNYNTYAFNPDGTQKWTVPYSTGRIYGSPAIATDGTIYVGSYNKYFYALNPNGSLKWSYLADNYIYGSPTMGADGTIYFGSYGGYLYAFNPNGTIKWTYNMGNVIYSTPAIGADGTLYIGGYDSKLYAFRDNVPLPIADFTADTTTGTAPLTVHFTDQSSGNPTSWAWDFNNDSFVDSTEQNPTYTYNTSGTYTVKLTVTNAAGSDDEIKTDLIRVGKPDLTASFTVPSTTDLSTNYPINVNVTNSGFSNAGEFNVRLFDNGVSAGTQRISLNALSSTTLTFNWKPKGTGTRTLTLLVDSLGEIIESNEANNAITATTVTYDKPELTASFTVPPETDLHTTYLVNVNIYNNGDYNAGEFNVRLFDNGVSAGTQRISLNALSSTTLTFNWKPKGTGTRTLTLLVDSLGEIIESNERNNVITATTVTSAKPELTASFTVPSIIGLNSIQLSVNVINTGGATGEFNVRLFDNGISKGTQRISLNDLETRTLTFNWTPTTTGSHTLTIIIDSLGEISETNETNNVKIATTSVIGTELAANFIIQPETYLSTNYPINIDITNSGTVATGEFNVRLFDNGISKGTQRISLNAMETRTLTFNWTPTTTGSHTLTIIIDSLGEIIESNERNNVITATTNTT